MVDAVTIAGTVAILVTSLMVIAMLYLVVIGIQSDRRERDVEAAKTEASDVETTEVEGEKT
ncbi:MAG: hypothetical protein ACQET5_03925 [Halobacteriota archaeon]|uniref:hypothetical protein n=1 Tax=Natronomonas sp. TaxID=2184060 RepID=UPI0039768821